MGNWGSYSPEDFLLFQPRVYWRLFELQNAAWWPLIPVALAAGLAMVWLMLRPGTSVRPGSGFRPGRTVAIGLAAAWLWVAWSFLYLRYQPINWAAEYLIPLFLIEALLLLWFGGLRGWLEPGALGGGAGRVGLPALIGAPALADARALVAVALALFAVAAYPFLAPAGGRPLASAEIFALAPDPTALATLGLLALAPRGWPMILLALPPVLWCLASIATLLVMDAVEGWVLLAALVAGLAVLAWPRGGVSRPAG